MIYGEEIWAEEKRIRKIQADYYRWVLRLNFNTPRYILRKKTEVYKMKIEWVRRAVKYEEKIWLMNNNRLIKI